MLGKTWKDQWDPVAVAAAVLLVFSCVFGGASRDHALRLALVELAALPLLVLGAARLVRTGLWREHQWALGLVGGLVAIPLIHLIPLPPVVWTGLAGREQMVLALELSGLQPGWAPLSLTPDRTWASALALLPPIALFVATLTSSQPQRKRLILICLGAAVAGTILGAAQLASGGDSLYPWATTGPGSMSGLFANRNHLAGLLLAVLPFAVVFGAASLRRSGSKLPLWMAAMFVGLAVTALAAIRSRAGVVLFVPVMGFSLLAAWRAAGGGRPRPALLLLVGAAGAALTAVAVMALPPILDRFDTEPSSEARFERWPIVAEAAQIYLPLGSGIGSFDAVYRSIEPLDQLDSTFFNQAHNEYLETWLEAGWPGVILILVFLAWYVRRTGSAWKARPSQDSDLRRAASIAVGVFLLHSFGDYPLRTTTLAVAFALCCGILELARPPREVG